MSKILKLKMASQSALCLKSYIMAAVCCAVRPLESVVVSAETGGTTGFLTMCLSPQPGGKLFTIISS